MLRLGSPLSHRLFSAGLPKHHARSVAHESWKSWEKTPPKLAVSDRLTQLKSTFQAYATTIPLSGSHGPSDSGGNSVSALIRGEIAPSLLAHLRTIDSKTIRASHAMYAWRFRSAQSRASGVVFYGSSNGGEAGAGERLERLLELGNCENVIVVVFRWYGGVKLGSDRWKCISTVAKEALERGGFLSQDPPPGDHTAVRTPANDATRGPRKKRR
ncbi:hypothetical protein C8Q79DRAFT_444651 [Trametes meyenii]|nr:hypothetical protein C8Q79DRAFT_444651 [Trametes meyenii]